MQENNTSPSTLQRALALLARLPGKALCCALGAVACLIMAGAVYSTGNAPDWVNAYFDMQLQRADSAFEVSKSIIGVLALAQSLQTGVGFMGVSANFEPFQLLEPLDIFAHNIANMLMWIIGTLHVQKKLAAVLLFVGCGVVLPLGFLAAAASSICPKRREALRRSARKLILAGAAVALCVPLTAQCSIVLERGFFTADAHAALTSLHQSKGLILQAGGGNATLTEKAKLLLTNAPKTIQELQSAIGGTSRDFLRLLGILGLTTFVLPPVLFLCVWFCASGLWAWMDTERKQ